MRIRCCHYLPRTFPNQSPLTKFINIRTHVGLPMTTFRHPTATLRFVSSNIITVHSHRFQHSRRLLLFVNGSVQFKSMATKLEESTIKGTGDEKKKGRKEEESAKELPPPPEKPEPGDCCGSGCVRCVWDVYYEELEAYNKLYKSDSKDSNSISNSS